MIFYIPFLIGLISFFVSYHIYVRYKNTEMVPWIYASSALAFIGAILIIYKLFFILSVNDKNLYLLKYSSEKVGKHLAKIAPNSVALIVSGPDTTPQSSRGKALIDGLKSGFGKKIKIKAVEVIGICPSTNSNDKHNPRGVFYSPSYQEYDELVKSYPLCKVVVFLSGLPPEFINMDYWHSHNMPATAVFNFPAEKLRDAIKMGLITAALSYDHKAVKYLNKKGVTPKNLDPCFVLVTGGVKNSLNK